MTQRYDPMDEFVPHYMIPHIYDADYYVIGDVHGCVNEYRELIATCRAASAENRKRALFIQLGDMIDRGPSFTALVLSDEADYRVMGNHEMNFIQEYYGYKECRSSARKLNLETMNSLDDETKGRMIEALNNRKLFFFLANYEGRSFVFSHAPIKGVEHGAVETSFTNASGSSFAMRSDPVDMQKLRGCYGNQKITFFHGHQSWEYRDINEQIEQQRDESVQLYNIDSNCVYGGSLVAVRLSDLAVFAVKSNVCVER